MAITQIGKYEVLRRLGTGGMGSLYLARDPSLDRLVALKLLKDEFQDEPELRARFSREAQSAARLRHPNIIIVYEIGEADGRPFMAMEYIAGETLTQVLRRSPPPPLLTRLSFAEDLCDGLAHAHAAGIVHRDIKPANIMLDSEGVLKILDFGIARLGSGAGMTQDGVMLGSVNYMSPEQVVGRGVDHRSDIFAAGAVLYEMVALEQAFPGGIDTGVLNKILNEGPVPLAERAPGVDPELAGIVQRALERDPGGRYQDAKTMRRDIARARRRLLEAGHAPAAASPPAPSVVLRPNRSSGPDRESDTDHPRRDPRRFAELRRQQVEEHLRFGAEAFARGDHEAALQHAERAATVDPDSRAAFDLIDKAWFAIESKVIRPETSHLQRQPGEDLPNVAPVTPWPFDAALPDADAQTIMGVPPPKEALERVSPAPKTGPVSDHTVLFGSPESSALPGDLSDVRLLVTDTADPRVIGRVFALSGTSVVIGRDGEWLPVADAGWSRRHAAIDSTAAGFVIRDLGSSNGTRVNGRRLTGDIAQPLFFGSRIAIGSAVLTFSHTRDTTLPDLTAAEVDGRYVLETRLRDGAKGALYAATDKRLPGRIAVKILSPELARYPGYRRQFQREAELARQLHHPHICQVMDYGQADLARSDGGTLRAYFLCLALMEGGNLADRLERREAFDTKSVAQWIDRIASALAYAHRRGLVHGDIKPTAIVFDGDDNPYVTDFAIAQQTEMVMGAPAYMAPELWESGTPSPAVDQFALAALSYYVITGSRPFEGQDHPEIRRRNFAQGPLPAHTEAEHNGRKGVLRGVSYVLARGLAKEPQDRYPTIADFAAALSVALIRPTRRPDAAQLFFSYQRESMAGWVNYFADRVRTCGLSVFVDTQNRVVSGPFPEQIAQAIEDAVVFVCFVGERTLESRWVQDEITLAYQYEKPMIPVFQEGYLRPAEDAMFPAMKKLLKSQGVNLVDKGNFHPEASVADLVRLAQRNIEVDEGPAR